MTCEGGSVLEGAGECEGGDRRTGEWKVPILNNHQRREGKA